MTKTLTFLNTAKPWMFLAKFKYDKKLMEFIKEIPGRAWEPSQKGWLVPVDMLEYIAKEAKDMDYYVCPYKERWPNKTVDLSHVEELHDYQKEGINRALRHSRWIFNDEMGLGKSAQGIISALSKTNKQSRVLVICPAIARIHWRDEILRWAKAAGLAISTDEVGVIDASPDIKTLSKKQRLRLFEDVNKRFVIVSYALVGVLTKRMVSPSVIIIDECHRLQSPASVQSKAVKELVNANPKASVFGLTATLFPNDPQNGFNVYDTIFPGIFGKGKDEGKVPWIFKERYSNKKFNAGGYPVYYGARPEHADEFRSRISRFTSRTTKKDVAHLLPAFDVRVLRIPYNPDAKIEPWMYYGGSNAVAHSQAKAIATKQAALGDLQGEDVSRTAYLTYHKEFAHKLCAKIPESEVVTGETPTTKRGALINRIIDNRKSLVATVDAVGISIDLTHYTHSYFMELHYRPEAVIQALGRFSRLSGHLPSTVEIIVVEGTVDEIIANRLMEKISAINAVCKAGKSEDLLLDALDSAPEDWYKDLSEYVNSIEEPEEYDL